ncbi:MAG: two-component regulator propeller domain-containing protein, partial [Bacteroidota bacterium]|nr:two-component regulator propeller domain-containing protein [Bacteroidota bacterium]
MKYLKHTTLFLLVFVQVVLGQDYYFEHYTVENGLSHNTVLSSLQDSKGFLWFGTKDGLNRFDGYAFKRFQNEPNDQKHLLGNYVESLLEYDGHIYAGTDNGLFRYD